MKKCAFYFTKPTKRWLQKLGMWLSVYTDEDDREYVSGNVIHVWISFN